MMDLSGDLSEESFWLPNSLDRETGKGIYHSDWRNYLNEINQKDVSGLLSDSCNAQRFVLYTRHIAGYFQIVAQELLMPPEVLYLAMDIFDRFWVNYLCGNREKQKTRLASLSEDPQSFRKNICLISLTCLQLASKQCFASKILSVPVIVEMMKKFGFFVEKRDVMLTELKVLQVNQWVMPSVTILTYVEMFVEQMSGILQDTSRSEIIQVCTKVLNVVICFHKEIYTKLHLAFKHRELRTHREKSLYLSVEGDSIRLAGSVVCTSGMLYDPTNNLSELMIDHLSKTTIYKSVEIRVLSQIIMHIILRKLDVPARSQPQKGFIRPLS